MSNTEILERWEQHSLLNIDKFSLSPIYTGMYLDRTGVEEVLDVFGIEKWDLESSTDSEITDSLTHIDNLMMDTTEIVREFILNYVFEELDSDGLLLKGHRNTVDKLCIKYGEVEEEFKLIRDLL